MAGTAPRRSPACGGRSKCSSSRASRRLCRCTSAFLRTPISRRASWIRTFWSACCPCPLSNRQGNSKALLVTVSNGAAQMNLVIPPLYVIIDSTLLKTSELRFAEVMAESGVELLQYRHKHATSRRLFEVSSALSSRLSEFARGERRAPRFIVNDRPDIAVLVHAGGVHVGQTDLGVAEARAIVSVPDAPQQSCWVGISTHTLEQVDIANGTSADYIAFGPVFPTETKEQPDPVVGLALLTEARARIAKPLVAIG